MKLRRNQTIIWYAAFDAWLQCSSDVIGTQQSLDPLDYILDYILDVRFRHPRVYPPLTTRYRQQTDANIAVTNHDDLYSICSVGICSPRKVTI